MTPSARAHAVEERGFDWLHLPSILPVLQDDPVALAQQIATLDHLCGGQVTPGIGFGQGPPAPRSVPMIDG